jgi:ligand-binding SRPBCC domain-containing protein
MARITLETLINAPVERVFTLSLSIDLHKLSMAKTNEEAIAGRTSGIIQEGEFVTWRAKHLGITQKLTVKITKVKAPNYFRDEMLKGAFKSMHHEHIFEAKGNQTLMIDVFEFESPLGPIGRLFNALFLENYMRKLLTERNEVIKRIAEGEEWKKLEGIS